ncbi:MAG: DUF1491 family protein [Erythrobacter sp.]
MIVMGARLPAHLEVSGMIRRAEIEGGFATVLQRGERDAGAILILTLERGKNAALWERMPQIDGSLPFTRSREEDSEKKDEFVDYIERRRRQDPDCWLIELDIVNAGRFIETMVT